MERTLAWDDGAVVAIDQCALPADYRILRLTSVDDVIDAIVRLVIRGAPAIGVADGVALAARAEHALWQRILRSARVKIPPDTAFACPEPGWFRRCHATDASTVATGINRLIRALETL